MIDSVSSVSTFLSISFVSVSISVFLLNSFLLFVKHPDDLAYYK